MINIAFDVSGNKLSGISSKTISEEVLLDRSPEAVILQGEYGELMKMRQPITNVNGVITEAPLPSAAEQADLQAEEVLSAPADEEARTTIEHLEDGVQDKSRNTQANSNPTINRGDKRTE